MSSVLRRSFKSIVVQLCQYPICDGPQVTEGRVRVMLKSWTNEETLHLILFSKGIIESQNGSEVLPPHVVSCHPQAN